MKKKKSKKLVLDSWSLLAYFKKEKSGLKVKDLFHKASEGQVVLYLNLINWGEVYYQVLRRFGEEKLRKVLGVIDQSSIELVVVDKEMVALAAEYKAKGKISFADCFVLATAKKVGGTIVTGDSEFKAFEKEARFLWL